MIHLFNSDGTGNDGIRHLIDGGKVTEIVCNSFDEFDRKAHALLTKVGPDDYIVSDTIGTLLDTTRGDIRIGANEDLLWEKLAAIQAGEIFGASYKQAGILIMRRLVNLRNRKAHIITIAHERDQRVLDGTGEKQRAPQVSPSFYGDLMGRSSDMFRLSILTEPVVDAKGNVKVPAGTRALQLRTSDEAVAKYQVKRDLSDKIPRFIYNPTWEKLTKALGKIPSWLTLYGPPGAGKTTLAVDSAEIHTKEETPK